MIIRCSGHSISTARRCASHHRAGVSASAIRALPSSSSSTDLPSSAATEPPPSARGRKNKPRLMPIGAFYDLDNIAPRTHRPSDARDFVAPLIEFGRRINGSAVDERRRINGGVESDSNCNDSLDTKDLLKELKIRANGFGNLSTRLHRSPDEKEHELSRQEYIPWTKRYKVCQTGYEKGVLRCGECGKKMTLTERNKKMGLTQEEKLAEHMKLHQREHATRLERMNKHKRLRGKGGKPPPSSLERIMWYEEYIRKHELAMVGVDAIQPVEDKEARMTEAKSRHDFFQVLREAGVRAQSYDGVGEALVRSARKWMKIWESCHGASVGECNEGGSVSDIVGVVVVYSRDGDFRALLDAARSRGFLAVSATDNGSQTRELAEGSDIVIGPLDPRPRESDGAPGGAEEDAASASSSSMFDGGNCCDEHGDISKEDEEVVRDVPSSPVEMFSAAAAAATPSRKESTIRAVPHTDRGLKFMRDMQSRLISNGGDDDGGNSLRSWDLCVSKEVDFPDQSTASEDQKKMLVSERDESGVDDGKSDAEQRLSSTLENARGKGYTINKPNTLLLGTKLTHKVRSKEERRNLRIRDRMAYECRKCGDQVKHWVQFVEHVRHCKNCGKGKARKIWRENKRRMFEVFFEEDETSAYECRGCGDRANNWVDFLDRIRKCESCGTAAARKMKKENNRKAFQVLVESPADVGGCKPSAAEARKEVGI